MKEFALLIIMLIDHNSGQADVRVIAAPSYEVCEEARKAALDSLGPTPDGFEVRARCVPTDALAASV